MHLLDLLSIRCCAPLITRHKRTSPHTLHIRRKLSREQAEDVDAVGFPDDGYDYRWPRAAKNNTVNPEVFFWMTRLIAVGIYEIAAAAFLFLRLM